MKKNEQVETNKEKGVRAYDATTIQVLEGIEASLRQAESHRLRLRAVSAQGRLSGRVMALLPVLLAAGVRWLDPTYLGPLVAHPVGRAALGLAGLLELAGLAWIARIVRMDA